MEEKKDWEKQLEESIKRTMFSRPTCPVCGVGTLEKMDAGKRGVSFAEGNFLGAFIKSHRCSNCSYSC